MREVREDANIDPTKCQFIGSRWSYQYKASQNEKYRFEREQKPKFASKKTHCKWFPNSYKLTSISILTLIRAIHANNDQKPQMSFHFLTNSCAVRYERMCLHGSAVEIDRTFNLVDCYLTTMLFTNPIRWGKKQWRGILHCNILVIRWSLGFDLPEEKFTSGTDEEKALVNANKQTFIDSLCLSSSVKCHK